MTARHLYSVDDLIDALTPDQQPLVRIIRHLIQEESMPIIEKIDQLVQLIEADATADAAKLSEVEQRATTAEAQLAEAEAKLDAIIGTLTPPVEPAPETPAEPVEDTPAETAPEQPAEPTSGVVF